MNIKQVIVIRKDLKMRRGKEIAQGAHASMGFITWGLKQLIDKMENEVRPLIYKPLTNFNVSFDEPTVLWLAGNFTKICCKVNSEAELLDIYYKAIDSGIKAHLIEDSGLTEFHGEKTVTCVAIGPDYEDKIDDITGGLELY